MTSEEFNNYMEERVECGICGKVIKRYQNNNAFPLKRWSSGWQDAKLRCCDECNEEYVIPSRLRMFRDTYIESYDNERATVMKSSDWDEEMETNMRNYFLADLAFGNHCDT